MPRPVGGVIHFIVPPVSQLFNGLIIRVICTTAHVVISTEGRNLMMPEMTEISSR